MRELLRESPVILEILSLLTYGMILWGCIRNIRATRKRRKKSGTEIVREVTPGGKISELKAANRMILVGFVIVIVIRVIGVVIYLE